MLCAVFIPKVAAKADVAEPSKIVWIGDSLTQGSLGVDNHNQNNPWAPYRVLESMVDIPVEGYGYYGADTNICLWAYESPERDGQVKDPNALYIFWVGSNDFCDNGAGMIDVVMCRIDQFINEGSISRYLVLGTTDRWEIRNGGYLDINSRFAEHYGDRFMDIMQYRYFAADDTHLRKFAYVNIGKAVFTKLVELGDIHPRALPSKRFDDVSDLKWYGKITGPIAYTIDHGIMSGKSDNTFEPEELCTRAQFVQILYNMEGKPGPGPVNPFADVEIGRWYTDAITWANANGITSGISPTMFGTDMIITREQATQFLMSYANWKGYNTNKSEDLTIYEDKDSISEWALNSVLWAKSEGIVNGVTDTLLNPKGEATRAEIAQMITSFKFHIDYEIQ